MPLNSYTAISQFAGTVYEGVLTVIRDNNLMAGQVLTFNDMTGMAPRIVPEYGTATMNTVADTDDLTSQAFAPAVLSTITPTEKGAQFFVTDAREETDPYGITSDASQELGLAAAETVERDLLALFGSLTGGTVNSPGTAPTWLNFFAMQALLRNRRVPQPWTFVCHPYHWYKLGGSASIAGAQTNAAPDLLNSVNRTFWMGNVGGVDIFTSSYLTAGTATTAAMFGRQAMALDVRRAPRLRPERDESRRGVELNLSTIYGVGTWRPTHGVQGVFDATAPS